MERGEEVYKRRTNGTPHDGTSVCFPRQMYILRTSVLRAPAQSGCITSAAPDRIHLFASTDVRSGPAKTKVGPRTVVV